MVEYRIPRVSIGLAVCNGERYLEKVLDAFLAQTYKDFELIIADNGSTDRTADICRQHGAQDHRIRYTRNDQNMGVAENYNRTVRLARGEYFRWATDDDLIAPQLLERCVEVLNRDPDVVLVYPKTINIDEDGNVLGDYEDNFEFLDPRPQYRYRDLMQALREYHCNAEYGLIRRKTLLKTGLEADFRSADKVLLSELVLHGKFSEVPERLYFHRLHNPISGRGEVTVTSPWFNPARAFRWLILVARRFLAFVKAVNRAPLGLRQRLYCYMQIMRFYSAAEKWQRLGQRIKSMYPKIPTPAEG